jgi:hypothetical protein
MAQPRFRADERLDGVAGDGAGILARFPKPSKGDLGDSRLRFGSLSHAEGDNVNP